MDSLFFHPKLVHIPMALAVLMPLIAGGLLVAWWRKWLEPKTWILAVVLQAVLLASGIAAVRSGEAEEERVENVVAESLIEEHEEAAEVFVLASGLVLGFALLTFVMRNRKAGLPLAAAATVGTLVVFFLGYRTGQAGGELVYKHGAAAAYVESGPAGSVAPSGKPPGGDHDDDD